jgi:hypothetical protein
MQGWCALVADADGGVSATTADGARSVRFDRDGQVDPARPAKPTHPRQIDDDGDERRFIAGDTELICHISQTTAWRYPERVEAMCLAADRRRLYVASSATVTELDTTTGAARQIATVPDHHLVALTLAPGGLVALDRTHRSLVGVNVRHGTSTTIFKGEWANPAAVAYLRAGDSYVVADAADPVLWLVARDGSNARRLSLRYD